MKIGVLALQGDFAEHIVMLRTLGVEPVAVRLPEHLIGLAGLIIPGGESTTIGKLAVHYNLLDPIQQFGQEKAVWGTCAGAIFISRNALRNQPLLKLMDITVARNAFGRQVDSFEVNLDVPAFAEAGFSPAPFPGVFIRAPLITEVYGAAQSLCQLKDGRIVAARQGRLLATAFHPELTGDDRFHRFFLKLASD
jgi:5'-phosphate synthase pdxT subunit